MKMPLILLINILLIVSCQSDSEVSKSNNSITYIVSERTKSNNLPFSDAVVVDNIIYLSGKLGITNEKRLIEGGIGPETKQALTNIKEFLEQNGSSIDNVIKCTCMLADIADWGEMSQEYLTFFPNHKPARSAFATNGLALDARVEIECMAYLKK
jgi:2-iminobutanoate/2-iminopropanoate deaminase